MSIMNPFDNAIHYGPNDAGASTLSIALVVIALIFGSWLFGALYALINNYIQRKGGKK